MVSTTRIKHKLSFVKIRSQHHGFSGHHISTRVSMLFKSDPSRKLSSAYNKFRGRAKNGTVSVYSKGSTRKSRSIRYSTNLGSMKFFVIAGIPVRDPQSHKIAILYSSAAGYKMYLPMTNRTNLLRVMFGAEILFKTTVLGSMMKLGSYRHCEYASLVKFYSRICFIAVKHSSRVSIARASGSSATTM
jgi:ribosomal protein L2